MARTYWLDLFTGTTWEQFIASGANISGFREKRWKTVQQVHPGDYLLCYLTGASRWIGVLEVTSDAFWDDTPVWKDSSFPCRVSVNPITLLTPETAVPISLLKADLSIFRDQKSSNAWTGRLRGSPTRWTEADAAVIVSAVEKASREPIERPVDLRQLQRKPKTLRSRLGAVSVPDEELDQVVPETQREPTAHDEVQWLLLKLGNDMGLDVWVAKNDRGKCVAGHRFADLSRMKESLPVQFDEATNRTVALIDVLWLRGHAIIAAFEVESTTSIYSGQ